MKLYIILFLLFCNLSYSHKNVIINKTIKNVEVVSSTGYYYEKSYKPLILAEYIALLCEKRNFKNEIFFMFHEKDFKGDSIQYNFLNSDKKSEKRKLKIDFFKNDFDVLKSLSLIDYLITDPPELSLSNEKIKSIYDTYKSDLAKEVLQTKIYRPDDVAELLKQGTISYYFMDNQYHFYEKTKKREVLLFSMDTVLNFKSFYDIRLAVMVSQNEILYFDNIYKENYKSISINGSDYYLLHNITYLRERMLIIELSMAMCCDKVICYLIEEDKVIEDLKEKLLKH